MITEPFCHLTGKIKYKRKIDAERVEQRTRGRARRRRKGQPTKVHLEAYRCPHCDHWHLGSRPKFRKRSGEGRRRIKP